MVISVLVIAVLVELLAIFWGAKLLKQELKRHSKEVETYYGSLFGALINIPSWNDLRAEWNGKAAALDSILNDLLRDLAGMEDQRRKDAEALEKEIGDRADTLTSGLNELRRDLDGMEYRLKKATDELSKELFARFDGCLSYGAETVKTLGGLWNESERHTAALQSLLAREDSAKALKQLRALLEDSPAILSHEQEAAMSKAMEDGIASILAYTSGKVPGVELHL